MLQQNKIIAAPATAPGIAGVSMIRVSGKGCLGLVDQVFRSSQKLSQKNSHEIAYGRLIKDNKILDEVMIGVFHHGRSFTGEESLEIWTHGSPYIVQETMNLLKSLGIEMAEAGEFSMRAFLNGKIDLTQAEAIKDLTESQTKYAHAQAINRLEGKLSSKIDLLHSQTLDLLALLEVAIDHAEEEVDIESVESQYLSRLDSLLESISSMLSTAQIGKMSRDGVKVALIGRPNVGKSSLLNALVEENRVIVSDIAGTTRDVIEHRISAHGLLIRFFDTAGLRDTDDIIEKEGTERSRQTMQTCDLIIHILDQNQELTEEDHFIINEINQLNKSVLTIFNKSDLPSQLTYVPKHQMIKVSAKNNEGIEQIYKSISEFYFSGGVDPQEDVLIANIRQEQLLESAKDSLVSAKKSIEYSESEEITAYHIRHARQYLEAIVGKTTDDAILDRIFSQFCIGK